MNFALLLGCRGPSNETMFVIILIVLVFLGLVVVGIVAILKGIIGFFSNSKKIV